MHCQSSLALQEAFRKSNRKLSTREDDLSTFKDQNGPLGKHFTQLTRRPTAVMLTFEIAVFGVVRTSTDWRRLAAGHHQVRQAGRTGDPLGQDRLQRNGFRAKRAALCVRGALRSDRRAPERRPAHHHPADHRHHRQRQASDQNRQVTTGCRRESRRRVGGRARVRFTGRRNRPVTRMSVEKPVATRAQAHTAARLRRR
jgi:hypothetical protein